MSASEKIFNSGNKKKKDIFKWRGSKSSLPIGLQWDIPYTKYSKFYLSKSTVSIDYSLQSTYSIGL